MRRCACARRSELSAKRAGRAQPCGSSRSAPGTRRICASCVSKSAARWPATRSSERQLANVVQGYFLACALGPRPGLLAGEEPAAVHLVPNLALADVAVPFDVLVNKTCRPAGNARAGNHRCWAGQPQNCELAFYSCNQEAAVAAGEEPQKPVRESARRGERLPAAQPRALLAARRVRRGGCVPERAAG